MISPIIEQKIKAELSELEEELSASAEQLEVASSFGDFRENEPFHIAKAKYVSILNEIQVKRAQLLEPVGVPVGNSITVGKLIVVTFLGVQDDRGVIIEPANEQMLLLFGEEGDPVVQGVLSNTCELGRLIDNGREGDYSVSAGNTSRLYNVRLYNGDSAEFFKKYPASKKRKIMSLLEGEL